MDKRTYSVESALNNNRQQRNYKSNDDKQNIVAGQQQAICNAFPQATLRIPMNIAFPPMF